MCETEMMESVMLYGWETWRSTERATEEGYGNGRAIWRSMRISRREKIGNEQVGQGIDEEMTSLVGTCAKNERKWTPETSNGADTSRETKIWNNRDAEGDKGGCCISS
ncbi:hypothetical protein HN011_000553 [Eciton burchellii]|nr:hypothetical protein HN011_000553 [Eciton burchellii]